MKPPEGERVLLEDAEPLDPSSPVIARIVRIIQDSMDERPDDWAAWLDQQAGEPKEVSA
jgi:hypothetical protein